MLLTRGYHAALLTRGYWPRAAAIAAVPSGLRAHIELSGAPADVGLAGIRGTWAERAVLADLCQLELWAAVVQRDLDAAVSRAVDAPDPSVLPWVQPSPIAFTASEVGPASLVTRVRAPADAEVSVFTITAEVIAEE